MKQKKDVSDQLAAALQRIVNICQGGLPDHFGKETAKIILDALKAYEKR